MRTPIFFLQSCFPASHPSHHSTTGRYSIAGAELGIYFYWASADIFLQLNKVPWITYAFPFSISPTNSNIVWSINSPRVHSIALFRSLIKTIYINLWDRPLVHECFLDLIPQIKCLCKLFSIKCLCSSIRGHLFINENIMAKVSIIFLDWSAIEFPPLLFPTTTKIYHEA